MYFSYMNVLSSLGFESQHLCTACIWRCHQPCFCVEVFMRHIDILGKTLNPPEGSVKVQIKRV